MNSAKTRTPSPAATAARPARATYRQLGMRGLNPSEAANVTAYLSGIGPVSSGWKIREIERLVFLRHLAQSGRLVS
jgi:hypothetical protein